TTTTKVIECTVDVPVAVSVIGYWPFGVVAEVWSVTVDVPSEDMVAGANVSVESAGSPDADSTMVCGLPVAVTLLSVVVAASPGTAKPERGSTSNPKSSGSPGTPQIACETRHARPSFDHVVCIANVPVSKVTFCDRPGPLLIHVHLSAFS